MTVYVVMANEDNASVESIHATLEGAKAAAEALAAKDSEVRGWTLDEWGTSWLNRDVGGGNAWSSHFVEPFEVKG